MKYVAGKWIEDIREKTRDMSREQAAEYVLTYYWYHILLGGIVLGLVILLVYHIGWGDRRKEFTCVLVNQEVDYTRDAQMAEELAGVLGLDPGKLAVDSDYLISYHDVELEGANESSYEKFFFNWSAGVIDAMVMPESFYEYCLELDGAFLDLGELALEEGTESDLGRLLEEQEQRERRENGKCTGVYLEGTPLEPALRLDEEDPPLLVFPSGTEHSKLCREFLQYVLEGADG